MGDYNTNSRQWERPSADDALTQMLQAERARDYETAALSALALSGSRTGFEFQAMVYATLHQAQTALLIAENRQPGTSPSLGQPHAHTRLGGAVLSTAESTGGTHRQYTPAWRTQNGGIIPVGSETVLLSDAQRQIDVWREEGDDNDYLVAFMDRTSWKPLNDSGAEPR